MSLLTGVETAGLEPACPCSNFRSWGRAEVLRDEGKLSATCACRSIGLSMAGLGGRVPGPSLGTLPAASAAGWHNGPGWPS